MHDQLPHQKYHFLRAEWDTQFLLLAAVILSRRQALPVVSYSTSKVVFYDNASTSLAQAIQFICSTLSDCKQTSWLQFAAVYCAMGTPFLSMTGWKGCSPCPFSSWVAGLSAVFWRSFDRLTFVALLILLLLFKVHWWNTRRSRSILKEAVIVWNHQQKHISLQK